MLTFRVAYLGDGAVHRFYHLLALLPSRPVKCYFDDKGANDPQGPGDPIQLAKLIIDKRRNKPRRSGLHPFKRPRARDQGGANQAVRLTTEQRGQKSLGWPRKPAIDGGGYEVSTACTTWPSILLKTISKGRGDALVQQGQAK
jgi:hypothetical protein